MLKKKLFYIDSHRRLTGSHSDFTYNIEIPKNEEYTNVVVLSAVIPKSYYLVQNGYNTMTLTELGVPTTITLAVGNYSATKFASIVGALLTSSSPHAWTYTITYPNGNVAQTGKFRYTVTGNSGNQPSFTFTNYVYEQFGFDPDTTVTFTGSVLTSSNVVKFQLEDTLLIHSDISTNGRDDILQDLPTGGNVDFSSIVYRCLDYEAYAKPMTTTATNSYHFSLTNEDSDQIMDLNGLNMVITVMLFRKDPVEDKPKVNVKDQPKDEKTAETAVTPINI